MVAAMITFYCSKILPHSSINRCLVLWCLISWINTSLSVQVCCNVCCFNFIKISYKGIMWLFWTTISTVKEMFQHMHTMGPEGTWFHISADSTGYQCKWTQGNVNMLNGERHNMLNWMKKKETKQREKAQMHHLMSCETFETSWWPTWFYRIPRISC